MSQGDKPDDDVDGLLESLTTDDGYREELETIPVDIPDAVPRRVEPAPPPEPTVKPRVPLPAASRLPRPRASEVRTAQPPAVNPSGPPRREPFPPAVSPVAPRTGTRPPRPPSAKPPPPRPRKFQGPMGFDDAEIDAALSPLSQPPGPVTRRSDPPPEEGIPTAPPPPPPAGTLPMEAPADSWNPPDLGPVGTESLDDLAAVEIEKEETPETRPSAELEISSVTSLETADEVSGADDAPSVHTTEATFEDWEDESVTSMRADLEADVSTGEATVTVEEAAALLDELGAAEDESPRAAAPASFDAPAPPVVEGERPAAEHLGEHRLTEGWVARADWFEAEAQTTADAQARARLLLAASELWAMTGQLSRAREAARRATQAAPALALASRQARWLAELDGDWKAVGAGLDTEIRTASGDAARVHAAYLSAEVQRLAQRDPAGAERRMDVATRAQASDPRSHLMKVALELGAGAGVPKKRFPDEPSFGPLAAALTELQGPRGGAAGEAPSLVTAFDTVRRALARGDRAGAGSAILKIVEVPGLGDGALVLAASLFAPSAETRGAAIEALDALLARTPAVPFRRALAARALEQGDGAAMTRALAETEQNPAFGASDRVALGALTGGEPVALAAAAAELLSDVDLRPLAAAAAAATDPSLSLPLGDPTLQALATLGRRMSLATSHDELKDAVHAVRAAAPDNALGRVLSLELDAARGATSAVATELVRLAPEAQQAEGKLAAALIEEASGRVDIARRHYSGALGAPRVAEAAARALLVPGDPSAQDLLSTLAAALGDETTPRQALLLYEAAVRGAAQEGGAPEELLLRSHDAAPELPLAARFGSDLAQSHGDAERLLGWIRKQREAARVPLGRALHLVREALLTADDDAAGAEALVQEALQVRPDDVALRELSERLGSAQPLERARFRERIAAGALEARTKARLYIEAASDYADSNALEDAERAARAAIEADGSELAKIAAERFIRDAVPAEPQGLARLRSAEQASLGQEDELAKVASELVDLNDRRESAAHARLAMRLRAKTEPWEAGRELVQRAARHSPRSLWVSRQLAAHARLAGDDAEFLEAAKELAVRNPRPLDVATLSLRSAEAAARLGRTDEAIVLLGRTLELSPDHLVARECRAALAEEKDVRTAAQDLEALARASAVPARKWEAWYRAAILWLDRAEDVDRGLFALEQAAALDVVKSDVFDRLQLLYVQRGERGKLAHLLEQRLAQTDDPEERLSLEITRGRALSDIGDREAARRALGAALEANPDHADALEAYAEICAKDSDWKAAEEAWIRLARVVLDPEKQSEIYGKLAALYDGELANPERSEICYREILRRKPHDPKATLALVLVLVRLGEAAKAIQLQSELIERATAPEGKRDLTLGLSELYDVAAKDKKSALALLEKSKKAWPHDGAVLSALARHHQRHGETAALNVLLERTAAEARRALSHGRFDLAFFATLRTAADVRGQTDAAALAGATLAALEGTSDIAVQGAGGAAASADLDDLVAPELLSPALRALLGKLPGVLDVAYPVDLKALRAAPMSGDLADEMRIVSESFGIRALEVLVSPALGAVIVPASSSPARLVVGQPLVDGDDDAARYFALVRALKMLQSQTAAFTRIAPIELWPVIAALLSSLAKSYEPQGVDAGKLGDARRRIEAALPGHRDEELATLALEVGGAIGNRASQLGQAVGQWGSRTGLLAVGSPAVALRGVALALGQAEGLPSDVAERLKWVLRHPEARDLAVFGVSEAYADARRRIGLGT